MLCGLSRDGDLHWVGGVRRGDVLTPPILASPRILSFRSARSDRSCSRGITGTSRLEPLLGDAMVSCRVTGGSLSGCRRVGRNGFLRRNRVERWATDDLSVARGAGDMVRRRFAGLGRVVAHRRRGRGRGSGSGQGLGNKIIGDEKIENKKH